MESPTTLVQPWPDVRSSKYWWVACDLVFVRVRLCSRKGLRVDVATPSLGHDVEVRCTRCCVLLCIETITIKASCPSTKPPLQMQDVQISLRRMGGSTVLGIVSHAEARVAAVHIQAAATDAHADTAIQMLYKMDPNSTPMQLGIEAYRPKAMRQAPLDNSVEESKVESIAFNAYTAD